jgi:hypothetical protein
LADGRRGFNSSSGGKNDTSAVPAHGSFAAYLRLIQNTKLTVHDIARAERVTAAYIYTLLRLPWLAPDITTAIINGRQPPQLNAKRLMRLSAKLPADWTDQRTLLGFR